MVYLFPLTMSRPPIMVTFVPSVVFASFIAGTYIVFIITITAKSSASLKQLPLRLYLCRQTRSRSSRQSTSESKNDRSGLFAAVLLTYLNGALRKNLVDLTLSLLIFKADDVTFLTRSVQFSLSDSFIPCVIKFQRLL